MIIHNPPGKDSNLYILHTYKFDPENIFKDAILYIYIYNIREMMNKLKPCIRIQPSSIVM